ncbi:phosphocholine cytidylyltransferase family protein [Mesorhizobium dulcispinae]|uniref:phosphocholine cytidylyltransferase family protein n=1 Tax=Mesorhizobium dulcispinae TaxID=3072316 RepID=UPI002A23EC89|nr:phosphocholine cytidylyltransferase family protein [Mesorhizobium sp. VK23D]MDX8521782.1 phosphocholine cytidylyltransferase family protein [Mesorhizobium sp. VK23D]
MVDNFTKQAVILAAGFGSRLRPLTDLRPKPLVEVNGTPILHNALRNLEAVGVEEVTIVVGYRKDAIEYSCGRRFRSLEISYVESDVFDKTGSAYSLWLARHVFLTGDTYVLEGDVYFEPDALRRLATSQSQNAAAVAPFEASMEGSAVILNDHGHIAELRMGQTAENLTDGSAQLFKTMNLIRFSGEDLRTTIVPHLDDLMDAGAVKSYSEELLSQLVQQKELQIAAVRCDDLKWYEIDSEEDLLIAERVFATEGATAAQSLVAGSAAEP